MSSNKVDDDHDTKTQVNFNGITEVKSRECWESADTKYTSYIHIPDFVTDVKQEILEDDCSEYDTKTVLNDMIIKQESNEMCVEDSIKFEDVAIKTEEVHIKCEENDCSSSYLTTNCAKKTEKSHWTTKTNKTKNLKVNFKCNKCSYRTPYKNVLSSHKLRHRAINLVTLTCSECAYKTTEKRNLVKHFRSHQKRKKNDLKTEGDGDIPRLKIPNIKIKNYPCSQCDYRSDQFYSLKMHVLRHHEILKDDDYLKCPKCIYQTIRPAELKKHMLAHDLSKRKMFKCTDCAYQSHSKSTLYTHTVRRHRQDVPTYECTECRYQTKDKSNMRHHMLKHTDASGGFVCHDCGFRTNYKQTIQRHILSNRLDEILMNGCQFCDFQTRHKCVLKKHSVCHRTES